ncbi:hypothetical protein PVAP13_2KG076032 [Panicum virgatum]|uniref:Uncharacterized protein n=1 Tax=Panicum virgatum TaxID=38727 RepID=A0A8T0VZR0_PANVG|nr:hypothetical protein PVAP13_2KG076032 [Panicum virgatum]
MTLYLGSDERVDLMEQARTTWTAARPMVDITTNIWSCITARGRIKPCWPLHSNNASLPVPPLQHCRWHYCRKRHRKSEPTTRPPASSTIVPSSPPDLASTRARGGHCEGGGDARPILAIALRTADRRRLEPDVADGGGGSAGDGADRRIRQGRRWTVRWPGWCGRYGGRDGADGGGGFVRDAGDAAAGTGTERYGGRDGAGGGGGFVGDAGYAAAGTGKEWCGGRDGEGVVRACGGAACGRVDLAGAVEIGRGMRNRRTA